MKFVRRVVMVAAFLATVPVLAQAQPRMELGASVISSVFALEDESLSSVGVPSAGLGLFNQGAYLSAFLGDRFAIEPQIGFMWASFDGESQHILNLSGQFTYFALGTDRSSPYMFAAAGFLDVSDEDHTPKSYGLGAGYRLPAGDRLVFRIDGRYTRYTGEFAAQDLDTVAVGLSIGGLFGQP